MHATSQEQPYDIFKFIMMIIPCEKTERIEKHTKSIIELQPAIKNEDVISHKEQEKQMVIKSKSLYSKIDQCKGKEGHSYPPLVK